MTTIRVHNLRTGAVSAVPAHDTQTAEETLSRETRRVVRTFQRFTPEARAERASSHRLGYRQRQAVGDFYYTHPDVPGRAFSTRGAAARAAVTAFALDALGVTHPDARAEWRLHDVAEATP